VVWGADSQKIIKLIIQMIHLEERLPSNLHWPYLGVYDRSLGVVFPTPYVWIEQFYLLFDPRNPHMSRFFFTKRWFIFFFQIFQNKAKTFFSCTEADLSMLDYFKDYNRNKRVDN
jgi:hypothetical protein